MTKALLTPGQFFMDGPYAWQITARRSGGQTPIDMFRVVQPAGEYTFPGVEHFGLGTRLRGHHWVEHDVGGAKRPPGRYHPSLFDMVPPGAGGRIMTSGEIELFLITLPLQPVCDLVREHVPGFTGDFGPLHAGAFHTPAVDALCGQLWRHSAAGNPYGGLFADGALLAIMAELLRLADTATALTKHAARQLTCAQLRRLSAYMDAHDDRKLALADLAAIVGMPQRTFVSAFKATTGQTPHQFVLDRRVTRAMGMLSDGRAPLAEIAYACGFASQSHMTDVFRIRVGVTPGRYRQARSACAPTHSSERR